MKSQQSALMILCAIGTAQATYEPAIVHVIYENASLPGIHAAEFAVGNLPFDHCAITEH